MGTLLFRYVGRRLLKWTAVVFVCVGGLFSTVSLLERIGKSTTGKLMQILWETILKLPELTYHILPASCAIGAAVGLATLENSRELVMMRIIGVRLRRLAAWVAVSGALATLLFIAVSELLLTRSALAKRELQIQRAGSFIDASEDIWVRYPAGFVRIGGLSADGGLLSDLTVFETEHGKLRAVFKAKAAAVDDDKWTLRSVSEIRSIAGEWIVRHHAKKIWDPEISPQLLASFSISPFHLSTSGLLQVIADMHALQQNPILYELSLWRKLADALSIPLLMLAGLWVVRFNPQPAAGLVQKAAAAALMVAAAFHFGSLAFQQYAAEAGLPPAMGPLVPVVLLALFVLARFARK